MRKFLLRSLFFFVLALLAVLGIFWWLNSDTALPDISEQARTLLEAAPEANEVSNDVKTKVTTETFAIPEGAIKLSTLTLGETQKKALQSTGINVETFVVTETMISCGVGKLGEARALEIFTGATPSLIEIGKLLPCLSK